MHMATPLYGYDERGRHLFRYDGDIHYEGVSDSPPSGTLLVAENEMATQFTGGYFLSGRTDPAFNIWADGDETSFVMSYIRDGKIEHGQLNSPTPVSHLVPICLHGSIVRNPFLVAEVCKAYPSSTVFACPVVEELSALGALVGEMRPRRAFLGVPNTGELSGEQIEYESNLDADCYGRMANSLLKGHAVWNQIYKGPMAGPFFGNILTNVVHPEIDVPVFMVRQSSMDEYFPDTPISAKYYAATTVPVAMKPSDKFKKATNCDKDLVSVMVSSDFIPGVADFMRFRQLMSGKDWVCVCPNMLVMPFKTMPVFRYNKAYKVPTEEYKRMVLK
jgi:hypothetical protein